MYRLVTYSHSPMTIMNRLKLSMLIFIVIFSILRGIYFALPSSLIDTDASLPLVFFEFPTYLFFLMYTTVLYIWLDMINKIKKLSIATGSPRTIVIYAVINILIFFIFAVFALLYSLLEEPEPLPCLKYETISKTSRRSLVNLIYLVFIAALALCMAILYVVLGWRFIGGLHANRTRDSRSRSPTGTTLRQKDRRTYVVKMTVVIIVTFGVMFLVRSILMLWAAAANGVIPLVVFTLLELVPSFVLLYYIMPPREEIRLMRRSSKSRSGRFSTSFSRSSSRKHVTSSLEGRSRHSTPGDGFDFSTTNTNTSSPLTETSKNEDESGEQMKEKSKKDEAENEKEPKGFFALFSPRSRKNKDDEPKSPKKSTPRTVTDQNESEEKNDSKGSVIAKGHTKEEEEKSNGSSDPSSSDRDTSENYKAPASVSDKSQTKSSSSSQSDMSTSASESSSSAQSSSSVSKSSTPSSSHSSSSQSSTKSQSASRSGSSSE